MARLPRLVLSGYPYHVTQRGNRRQQVFFEDADYVACRDLLAEAAHRAGAEIWAYRLMPNHVHVIVVPSDEDTLVAVHPALERYGDFAAFLGSSADYTEPWRMLRKPETTGRPIGARDWVERIEKLTGRALVPQKRGPKPRV